MCVCVCLCVLAVKVGIAVIPIRGIYSMIQHRYYSYGATHSSMVQGVRIM